MNYKSQCNSWHCILIALRFKSLPLSLCGDVLSFRIGIFSLLVLRCCWMTWDSANDSLQLQFVHAASRWQWNISYFMLESGWWDLQPCITVRVWFVANTMIKKLGLKMSIIARLWWGLPPFQLHHTAWLEDVRWLAREVSVNFHEICNLESMKKDRLHRCINYAHIVRVVYLEMSVNNA